MKNLLLKLLILFSPFIFISLLILMVDPYNLFNVSKLFSDEIKVKCINRSNASSPRGNILWKTIKFKRNPTPNIILGDSRMMDISPEFLELKIGGEVSNLAIPAGNNRTIIDLFWMASDEIQLNNVFIQINFNNFNAFFNYDIYKPTKMLLDRPINYFMRWDYIEDAFSILYYSFTSDDNYIRQSYKFSSDGWYKTEELIINDLSSYKYIYPKKMYEGLQEIAYFCGRNKINLTFVIAPDYFKTHTFIKEYNLEKEYVQFKKDIARLGTTYDLDYGSQFSFDKNNYMDYFHINPALADTIIAMIYQADPISQADSDKDLLVPTSDQ